MSVNCVLTYNDTTADWASWDDPWFLHAPNDQDWGKWATQPGTSRQLVIAQNLFPSSEDNSDWLAQGAAGDFEPYAVTLAQNLIDAGLGSSIIRLAHEANGTWYPDSIPDTSTGDAEWVQFWDNTVTAMRSVPGANFRFDWTVNANYRDIPLADWYPGDAYVDIVGIDAYDGGDSSQTNRWQHFFSEADGVQAVEQFASAHSKPLSIPEWGLGPSQDPATEGGGDDPAFVNGLASVVENDDVAYQSYFFNYQWAMQLEHSPNAIAAYRSAFGEDGSSETAGSLSMDTPLDTLTPTTAPSLTLTGGPGYGASVDTGNVAFTFAPQSGLVPTCSVDGASFGACTSATNEVLSNLAPGYHWLQLQVMDANDNLTSLRTWFTVS